MLDDDPEFHEAGIRAHAMFAGVPEDERDLICAGNAARLYKLDAFLAAEAAA
jgi:hypothetical protein